MIKGPLVYAAVILAAALMAMSALMVLARDFFIENQLIVMVASGLIALGVIVVLIMMLIRTRRSAE